MKITKNKNQYFSYLQKQFSKFAVVLVVVSMFASFLNINQTYAYFSDTETSTENTFTAGTLSIDLNNTNTFSSGLLYPTDSTSTSMNISNTGSLGSQYIAKTTLAGSDTSACDYVTMTATSPTSTYTGLIKDFISPAIPTASATWNYNFTISPTAPSSVWDKTCYFKWVYTAWQDNLPNASSGFLSVKEKLGSVRIGKAVVLNEILYNPDTNSPAPANKEFIELYNNSNVSFDLAGWQVSEISGVTEKKYTISITGDSLTAVPYSGSTIISPNGWMTLILSDGTALNNDGDTVRLYDASNNKLDEHAYTGDKPQGYSDARIPDGVGAWVDPIPTPGASNELAEEIIPVVSVEPEELLPSASLPEEIPPATEEEVAPAKEQPTEEVVTEPILEEEIVSEEQIVQEESAEEVTVVEPVVEEVLSEPVVEQVVAPIEDVAVTE